MNSSVQDKAELRRALRRRRSLIPPGRRRRLATLVVRHLLRSRPLRRARCVAVYLHHGSEVATTVLIDALLARGVRVLVPRIATAPGRMDMVALPRHARPCVHGPFGIAQPRAARRWPRRAIDAMLIPLVAYDARGHRLGSGGGYYDRWLARSRGSRPRRIGLAYSIQRVSALPDEGWDIRLHAVATERGIRYFSQPTTPRPMTQCTGP
ncbi:5-formyltetrahydrofolate cyclo-ligase [Panacagrimonas sp.]|uniref:5-formyltetrahydrofolate cyclo-ligase n=1 Tax=Panacagrimonas sp. TaxID=2480088 RepID=UPI003B52D885